LLSLDEEDCFVSFVPLPESDLESEFVSDLESDFEVVSEPESELDALLSDEPLFEA
jgi:hypothetical protein